MSNPLQKLTQATTMLAEAKTFDDVKGIIDIAEAARTYARAAKLGLDAQNHAAELKLRAERKAGELLAGLERGSGPGRGNTTEKTFQSGTSFPVSEYRTVLQDTATAPVTAHRWQTIATVPDEVFEQHVATIKADAAELTSAGVLRVAKELEHAAARMFNAEQVRTVVQPKPAMGTFSTILIDPPWDWGDEGDVNQFGRAKPRYATMPYDEIMALPLAELASPNAHLYLWITNRSLPNCSIAYLYPFQMLRMAFVENFSTWKSKYKRGTQTSDGWTSECSFVPEPIVWGAIQERRTIPCATPTH